MVAYIQGDDRWAQLGQAFGMMGGSYLQGLADKNKGKLAADVIEKLDRGEVSVLGASGELMRSGMSPEDIDRLMSNMWEDKRQQAQIQSTEKIAGQADTTQRYSIDTSAGTARREQDLDYKLGAENIAAANYRAQISIASEEKMQGRALSHDERMAIYRAEQDKEMEGLRAGNARKLATLQGAIESQLGVERGARDLLIQNDQQDFLSGESAADRELRKRIELLQQEGQNARLERTIGADAERQDDQQEFLSAEGLKERTSREGLARESEAGANWRAKLNVGASLYEGERNRALQFYEGTEDRKVRREAIKAEGVSKMSEGQRKETARIQGLVDSAGAMGIDLSRVPEDRLVPFATAYGNDADTVLNNYAKQLGIDRMVMTPDGMFDFEGSKVGGVQRLKLETASGLLSKLYLQELAKPEGQATYQSSDMLSKLMQMTDNIVNNASNVLPKDALLEGGIDIRKAANYLMTQKGFTINDVKSYLKTLDPNITDDHLEKLLD